MNASPDIDLTHVANLARLNLTDAERTEFAPQLEHILGYVQKLEEIDVTDLPETAQVTGLENVLRPDEAKEYTIEELRTRREALLAAAPTTQDGLIKVPAILTEEV